MKNYLLLALAVVGITACHKDCDESMCAAQYPQNNQGDVNLAPLFEWCTDDTTTLWHFQLDSTSDMHTPCVDTSLNDTQYRLYRLFIPYTQPIGRIPLAANEDYYWRIGKVNADGTTSWRSVQKFNTLDDRNLIIGTHTVKRYYYGFMTTGGWGNQVYQGTTELEVSKLGSKGIKIKDLGTGLSKDLYPYPESSYFYVQSSNPNPPSNFNPYDHSRIEFNINETDSIYAIIQIVSNPQPESGYVYKGHY